MGLEIVSRKREKERIVRGKYYFTSPESVHKTLLCDYGLICSRFSQ